MEKQIIKRYPTIACCGIDCGLCPRYYTEGKSRCPGCLGEDFFEKHPSCSIVTCCFKNNGYETCAECKQFPCEKIKKWDIADSFVTHKKSLENLRQIRDKGLGEFIKQQKERIKILEKLIKDYDDGKSKSFYCLATALMEIEDLKKVGAQVKVFRKSSIDMKQMAKQTKSIIEQIAKQKTIELVYRREKA